MAKVRLSKGLLIGTVFVIACVGALLMGASTSEIKTSVKLSSLPDKGIMTPGQVAIRQEIFGVDPMGGSSLELNLHLNPHDNSAVGKKAPSGRAWGSGVLRVGKTGMPVSFDGLVDASLIQANSHMYHGDIDGAITVGARKLPASLVIAGVPNSNKYLVTMTVKGASQRVGFMAFGQVYPEYTADVSRKFDGKGN